MSHQIANFFHNIGFGGARKAEHTGGERTRQATVKHTNQANPHQMKVSKETSLASSIFNNASDIKTLQEKFPEAKLKDLVTLAERYTADEIEGTIQGYNTYKTVSFEELMQEVNKIKKLEDSGDMEKLMAEIDESDEAIDEQTDEELTNSIEGEAKHLHIPLQNISAYAIAMEQQNLYENDPTFAKENGITKKSIRKLKAEAKKLDATTAKQKLQSKKADSNIKQKEAFVKSVDQRTDKTFGLNTQEENAYIENILEEIDQEIAKDETADLPDVPFNANDLPDVPNTPVNSESSIAENSQPKVKRRVAETE